MANNAATAPHHDQMQKTIPRYGLFLPLFSTCTQTTQELLTCGSKTSCAIRIFNTSNNTQDSFPQGQLHCINLHPNDIKEFCPFDLSILPQTSWPLYYECSLKPVICSVLRRHPRYHDYSRCSSGGGGGGGGACCVS